MDSSTIERKRRSRTMGKYIAQLPNFNDKPRTDLRKLASNLDRCAAWLLYHEYYTLDQTRLVAAETCKKHLLCPFCAAGRGARSIAKNMPKVEDYIRERPNLIPVLLTLTVKNGSDLGERYRHLKGSFSRITRRRRDANRRRDPSEFGKIDGAIYSFEQTYQEDTGWHPHVHMMAFLTDWIDHDRLRAEWLELTGDSSIVDIRLIRPKNPGHGSLGIEGALCEVYKYAVKLSDLDEELAWHAYQVLKGKRLTGALGALYGRVVESDEVVDKVIDGAPYIWRFYRWTDRGDTYDLTKHGVSGDMDPTDSVGYRAAFDSGAIDRGVQPRSYQVHPSQSDPSHPGIAGAPPSGGVPIPRVDGPPGKTPSG